MVSPYKQARSIPHHQLKTKTDAWNGYQCCPLEEEKRPLTTFETEWGRYRYKVIPEGFKAAGDGYNQRYNGITDDVESKTRCIDDVAL